MLKKFKKIAFWLVFLTLYLNIGWGLGYYFHYSIETKTFESASWHAKLLVGHNLFANNEDEIKAAKERGPWETEVLSSIFWPFLLLVFFVCWIVYIAFWILKFIFWGGLFKLVFGIP